jgi:NTP pyrophosphatase (non-canonical NTP hydrolase)
MLAEQKEDIKEELLETVMSSLALAGLLGIDLQRELMDAIALLEQVTAEGA